MRRSNIVLKSARRGVRRTWIISILFALALLWTSEVKQIANIGRSLDGDQSSVQSVLLCLNLPPASEVGLDMLVRNSGPKFTGFRGVDAGPHFLYLAPAELPRDKRKAQKVDGTKREATGIPMVRNAGEWLWIAPRARTIAARKFDESDEILIPLNTSDVERLSEVVLEGIGDEGRKAEIENGLYDLTADNNTLARNERWRTLTSFISKEVIERLRAPCHAPLPSPHDPAKYDINARELFERPFEVGDDVLARIAANSIPEVKVARGRSQDVFAGVVLDYSKGVNAKVPVRLKDYEVTVLMESKQLVLVRPLERPYYYSASYTRVPKHTDWSGLTPAEKTRMAMDSSYLLELTLKRYLMNDTDLLLGEVQYSFLSAVIGGCTTSLHQWKQLLALMCNCEKALLERIQLFRNFNEVLLQQIKFSPRDYESLAGIIRDKLEVYLEILADSDVAVFSEQAKELKKAFKSRFGWKT